MREFPGDRAEEESLPFFGRELDGLVGLL